MDNWITALIALALVAIFLMGLAVSINAIPFFIICAVVLVLIGFDFRQTRREVSGSTKI
jgi:Flp pilus assembly protein TadB